MNRRDLLKKIGIAAPALVAMPLLASEISFTSTPETSDSFMYRGWRVVWRGWRQLPNQDAMIGMWIGYSTDKYGLQLASCWPGKCGSFYPGYTLDVSLQRDQILPSTFHLDQHPKELEHFKSECLERLKRLIHKVGRPPLREATSLD